MKLNIVITTLLVVAVMTVHGLSGRQDLNRPVFYAAMSSDNIDSVNAQLGVVTKSSAKNKDAFEGTLLMKKAGLASGTGKKLKLFKAGRGKLESVITKENKNVELRFLRLMIQEHAPGILNYNGQIDEDSQMVKSGYKSLPPTVQQAVVNYTKKSKVLKPEFF